jgi:D-beta-D-heptose 7-phosphate kinase/D-beta-D-heptose 1-phosphate adenosyltransferase
MREAIVAPNVLEETAQHIRKSGKSIVFTNGCFDLLHPGHMALLESSAKMGDVLIVAINDDASVRRLKGATRPVYPDGERAEILAGVRWVDYVTIFGEDTPLNAIRAVAPDVLVKGAEYGEGEIVGEEFLHSYGGVVVRFPMVRGFTTSDYVRRIKET